MYMQHQRLPLKFLALQLPIIISNVQPLIFGIIARYALDCIGSRGPRMRASGKLLLFFFNLYCMILFSFLNYTIIENNMMAVCQI